ncbi:MAG TPA: hypothetical protein VMY16_01725 [Ilumatobacteraceae bacterium]|nr:hypothetical protein [Ilumatobacteraceae bacterium]
MGNDHWLLFDLEVRTPRLTLRYLDDELARALVGVAANGIHAPTTMPFSIPWTDLPSPQTEQEAMRFYARTRAEIRPNAWNLQFAVVVDQVVVGACDLRASDFPALRQFTTGSWLARRTRDTAWARNSGSPHWRWGSTGTETGRCGRTTELPDGPRALGDDPARRRRVAGHRRDAGLPGNCPIAPATARRGLPARRRRPDPIEVRPRRGGAW